METVRKKSRKREAMLAALRATTEHPTAEMLYNTLKPEYPELSLGTVYRNLDLLVETLPGTTLLDLGGLQDELQELLAEGTYVADLFGRWSAHE